MAKLLTILAVALVLAACATLMPAPVSQTGSAATTTRPAAPITWQARNPVQRETPQGGRGGASSQNSAYIEFGTEPTLHPNKTASHMLARAQPVEIPIDGLQPNTLYSY